MAHPAEPGGHHSHEHHEHHEHDDFHSHRLSGNSTTKLAWVFVLTSGYMILQFIGSYLSGSLALFADSSHMLGDAFSLGVALFAANISRLSGFQHHTFGFARFEILAALFNGLLLAAVAIYIFLEAINRFFDPHVVQGSLMLAFAVGGLIVNLIAVKILHGDHQHNLNVRGAYLHVLSDLLGSVGAIAAGLMLILWQWVWADALIGIVIAILVLSSSLHLVRATLRVLMEATPAHISLDQVKQSLLDLNGVLAVHNLHVWQVNSDKIVLTAHLMVQPASYSVDTLSQAQSMLVKTFHLNHATLQLELENPSAA